MTSTTPPVDRKHTRATSILYIDHAFSLFGSTAANPILLGLQNKLSSLAAVSLMDLIGFPADEFQFLEYDDGQVSQMLTRSQVWLAKNVQSWAIHEFNKTQMLTLNF